MEDRHRHLLRRILTEEMTLEELTEHFITLVKETIIPFIKKLEAMYYSKVDLNLDEQNHIRELKDIVVRYLHFETRVIEQVHNNQLVKCLETEIDDVKKITKDVKSLDIDGLEKDFEDLLIILESVEVRLKHALAEAKNAPQTAAQKKIAIP